VPLLHVTPFLMKFVNIQQKIINLPCSKLKVDLPSAKCIVKSVALLFLTSQKL